MGYEFKYAVAPVSQFRVVALDQHSGVRRTPQQIEVGGQRMKVTPRFWRSFCSRYAISDNIFRYFDYHEVFRRITERSNDDRVRICVERDSGGELKALAVSNPQHGFMHPGELIDLVRRYGHEGVRYDQGVITSEHTPASGEFPFAIGCDEFKRRFVLETPIDGFGHPRIYLSVLRLICTNGMVGYTPAFRTEIRVGKDAMHAIRRALESFDNGEGYAALRQRFESAQTSWASLNEVQSLYRILVRNRKGFDDDDVIDRYYKMTGRPHEFYGLANLDAVSIKQQRILPTNCRIYDLLNFASEVATHHAKPDASRVLNSHIGTVISDEYDMEGTGSTVNDFKDFFLDQSAADPQPSAN